MIVPRHPLNNENPYQNQPVFWNTEKLVDFIQFPLFKTIMQYCVSAGIFMKNNAASWNVKIFRAKDGKKQALLI